VLEGKDTLALMPTGGGKSLCFQVPALALDGLCIVVSPLIALMKDQVEHLNQKGVKALAITSAYSYSQVDAMFDRCIYDSEVKFLYLSPERLSSEMAMARIPQMNVSLIAVDEAHCISEWGYDFRPAYLNISELRSMQPNAPVVALTASATPVVVEDIQEKLGFGEQNVFRKSFYRENLSYWVAWEEDKFGVAERIARKHGGSGIIYMRSRKGTERITRELGERGMSIAFYHAGLDTEQRSERQLQWMRGDVQVIAATNAFGMGIDKPDVRFVIHMDIPDTLENYYQECGRAGRDGNRAFAVALLNKQNVEIFKEKLIQAFPTKEEIKHAYGVMCNSLQLAIGSAKEESFALDITSICQHYSLEPRKFIQCLKFLEREGYIVFKETSDTLSSLQFKVDNEALYQLKVSNEGMEPLIDGLLRSYSRLFEERSFISEWTLANRIRWPKDKVVNALIWLDKSGYITYQKASLLPTVLFLQERISPKNLRISQEHYDVRKQVVEQKAEAMLHYIESNSKCRSRLISEYFGEADTEDCGICDVCTG